MTKPPIVVGNEMTAVTEAEAAKGRRDLADFLDNWWLSASQKTPAYAPEKLDISWGKMKCQLELSTDQAKSPQIILRGAQSAPPSIREVIDKFLLDTCHVESVDAHFRNEGIKERAAHTATNIASPDPETIDAPMATFRSGSVGSVAKLGMFQRPPASGAPKQTPATPEPTLETKKGGPSSSTP